MEILDVVASANVRDTLDDSEANAAVSKVIGQLPSKGHKPHWLALQEWNRKAPACIKGTVYEFVRAEGGGGPCLYDRTRSEIQWTRTRVLAPGGFVGRLPGRRSRLSDSKAAIYCFADEEGGPDVVIINVHLTAEVQRRDHYWRDAKHHLRVVRHKLERATLALIVRHHVNKGRRVYVTGDTNFDEMTLKPLKACWVGHEDEEAAGTLGNRTVDYVYAPDKALTVRRVPTRSDHDAVVAQYSRRRI